MTESILNEYISRVKRSSDGDAFHSLIEAGEEAVTPVIRAVNTECSVDQFKRLIEVLQEIRTTSALAELRQLCLMNFSKKLELAAEGLFYNNPEAANRILGELIVEASPVDREAKTKVVAELLASLGPQGSSPTSY
jgi:hypothetical protein